MPNQKQHAILFADEPEPELQALTHHFSIEGHEAWLVVVVDSAQNVKEIGLVFGREGSFVAGLAEGISKIVTLALQHGVSLQVIIAEFKGMCFEPSGMVTNKGEMGEIFAVVPPAIPTAQSVLDYIARWLEVRFVHNQE